MKPGSLLEVTGALFTPSAMITLLTLLLFLLNHVVEALWLPGPGVSWQVCACMCVYQGAFVLFQYEGLVLHGFQRRAESPDDGARFQSLLSVRMWSLPRISSKTSSQAIVENGGYLRSSGISCLLRMYHIHLLVTLDYLNVLEA